MGTISKLFFTTKDTKKSQSSQRIPINCGLCENPCEPCGKKKMAFRSGLQEISTSLILFLVISFHLPAQEPEIRRERIFTGEGLYGFMNGAADQYIEYGFKTLITRDITYRGEAFTVDIYEMPSSEDAYGIYSMHVFRCQQADSMGYIDCFSPYQLQAIVDNLYISIVFPSGSDRAQQIAGELIPLYIKTEHSSMPDIPGEIGNSPPISGAVKYLRGPLSVSSTSRDLTALLKDVPYRGVWFRADPQTKSYRVAILFSASDEMEKFKQTLPDTEILSYENDMLIIRRKEKESETSKSGEFGF